MAKRRVGTVFVGFGAVLLCAALLLFLYNQRENKLAEEASSSALDALHAAIENKPPMLDLDEEPEEVVLESTAATVPEPTELTIVNVEGYDYVGYLSIPRFELELPIIATCTEDYLYKAPCLQYGSPLTDDAVIAGHNYKAHFLSLFDIEAGDTLSFTDMTGYTIEYRVVEAKIISPTAVSGVINSEYDLQLYTCTSGGKSRVLVCCNRADKISSQAEEDTMG